MNVIVGAGIAAVQAAESMREAGYDGPIVMLSGERELPYEKPPLSKGYLRGDAGTDEVFLRPDGFFAEKGIRLELGRRAVELRVAERRLLLDDGGSLAFERLLIATGAAPARLEVPGAGLEGILSLRTLEEAAAFREALVRSESLVVVGAGLVGLEVAASARLLGKRVTVVERAPAPLSRFLGAHGRVAAAISALHRDHGVGMSLGRQPVAFEGKGRVEAVILDDGSRLDCDLVLVAIGVRPGIEWLRGSGLALSDGIPVDETGATQLLGVWAAGDVARTFHHRFGRSLRLESYGNAFAQGANAGRAMAGAEATPPGLPGASSEQFGVRMQVVGLPDLADGEVVRGEPEKRSFTTFFTRGDRLVGAFAMGRPKDVVEARKLILAGAAVDREQLAGPRPDVSERG